MRIKKCCCCISLHVGCLIIAILSLISAIAASFGMSKLIAEGNDENAGHNQLAQQSNIMMKFIICIISALICFVLIYGTVKKNRKMVMAWVILMGCQCVLVFVLIIRLIHVMRSVKGEAKSIVGGILGAVIIEFIVCLYCWLVVWSRYSELRDEARAAANTNPPERTKLNDRNASSNC